VPRVGATRLLPLLEAPPYVATAAPPWPPLESYLSARATSVSFPSRPAKKDVRHGGGSDETSAGGGGKKPPAEVEKNLAVEDKKPAGEGSVSQINLEG
jgi:hypothetical protein